MPRMWMVRAERGGRLYDDFKDKNAVAIGWHEVGSLESLTTREQIATEVAAHFQSSRQAQAMSTGQLHRFRNEMEEGDRVVTYDPGRRVYLVGTISGPYRFDPSAIAEEDPNVRPVDWHGEVSRDLLKVATRNSLGAISALFLVPPSAAEDLERALVSHELPPAGVEEEGISDDSYLLEDIQSRALEFIKDRVTRLDWDEMQKLVAGLLRAMGYKTIVSPAGPDRGKDIIASPDGFGFEAPRIVVEVKHRHNAADPSEIRSFLGGRHRDDKGLYVSTGGFSKDARYEADRANIPLHLMGIDDLVQALVDNYEALDTETRQLLPLKRVYWPI